MDGRVGTASFSWLLFENQEEQDYSSPTLISQTENGGEDTVCAYYRWPTAMAGRLLRGVIAPGMKLRGEGESVMIPPSVRRNGIRYVYLQPDVEVAVMPDWLLELASDESMENVVQASKKLPLQWADLEFPGSFEKSSVG
jgi:hypothetical protein